MLVMLAAVVTGAVAQTDLDTPLTLEAKGEGTITISFPQEGMQFSKNGGTKYAVTNESIVVEERDVVTFYGNGTSITSYSGTNIRCYGEFYIYGNIMSLVDEVRFATATKLTEGSAFQRLFAGNSNLYSHPTQKLVLPATTLAAYCYSEMFDRCINLTTAPELPATNLAESCYQSMFSGCTNLTTVPEKLPATTLADYCYYYMFNGCTNLTTAPVLPAIDLALHCYNNMFSGCTSLTTAPKLPATDLAEGCYNSMFYGCTSLKSVTCLATKIEDDATSDWLYGVASEGTFIKAEGMESWTRGGSGIPSGWTTTDYVTLTNRDDISEPLSTYAGKTCLVNYTRSFTSGKASTVCLPFAYTPKTGEKFYTFTGITKDGGSYIANMTEVVTTPLAPNTPYLFMPTGNADFSGTYTIPESITAGTTTVGDWTFVGTYTTKKWETEPTGIYGFSAQDVADQGISQGQFVKVGKYVRVKPMRCYLKYKDGGENYAGARGMNRAAANDEPLPETIKVRLISADGEVTAIGTMQTKTGEVTLDGEAWYSMDGRRIVGKPSTKGIYVNNGHKMIIK